MVAACELKGVMFRLATDVDALPGLLAPFDRIVVATGADIASASARSPNGCSIATWRAPRAWRGCSHGRRCATGSIIARGAPPASASGTWRRPGQKVVVIGDAVRAGKSKPAISSAFEAALLHS